jgi:hypothetical protein
MGRALFAIKSTRKDTRDRGFTNTTWASKNKGMSNLVTLNRIHQRTRYMFLPIHGIKRGRTIFAR